jgi:hypothetical protein
MLYGWPITELVKVAFPYLTPGEQARIAGALHQKHVANTASLFSPSHLSIGAAPPSRPYSYEERLAMRMGWARYGEGIWAPGFEHIAIHEAGDIVHIWVISKDGQSTVLQDDGPLFPSDALVTKLNMLKQE